MEKMYEKREKLADLLLRCGSLAVAFSGGVDSAFLLQTAYDLLGDRTIAVTAAPPFVPEREREEALSFCRERGIRQILIPARELDIESVRRNPPDRCYHCKQVIFRSILETAAKNGISAVAEGSNADDAGDYRPGMRAVRELGVLSPLLDCGLSKEEIRMLSKERGLPTWDKPSFACLASRFVYGETITDEKLAMVEKSEQFLYELGFRQFRVRIHGTLARIEILPEEFGKLMNTEIREKTVRAMKNYGFSYVAMDLAGYRTGSMNEGLKT